ncbi:MAG: nucleotide exchange factor GrpE [Bacteroidota bacterium]
MNVKPQKGTPLKSKEKPISPKEVQNTADTAKPSHFGHKDYLRLLAEFENYKSRSHKEQLYWIKQANKKLLTTLIPILDDFERALANATPDEKGQRQEGMQLIYQKFSTLLNTQGLQALGTAVGDDFDPTHHEALATIPNTDEKKKGKIAQIVNKGYQLNQEIIRFAKVIVNA